MGLKATIAVNTAISNPTQSEPDRFQAEQLQANQQVWWLATTPEIYMAMADQHGVIDNIHGSTYMPQWDEMILSTTPGLTMRTLYYHCTEQHISSVDYKTMQLVAIRTTSVRHLHRQGGQHVNYFLGGHLYPQPPIEDHSNMSLILSKKAEQVVYNITAIEDDTNITQAISVKMSWQQGYMWSFNIPLEIKDVATTEDPRFRAFLQALEYTGFQVLQHLDQQDAGHIQQLLSTLDPKLQSAFSVNATCYGQKTLERVRGNASIWNWLRDSKCDFEEWIKEVNNFRQGFNKMDSPAQDINMVDNLAE